MSEPALTDLQTSLACGVQADTSQALGTKQGALMHVAVSSINAVIVLGSQGIRAKQQAVQDICAVDAASEGVPMHQVDGQQKIHLFLPKSV